MANESADAIIVEAVVVCQHCWTRNFLKFPCGRRGKVRCAECRRVLAICRSVFRCSKCRKMVKQDGGDS